MRYIEISEHDLNDARSGLALVERLLDGGATGFNPYIYGLTSKKTVLLTAERALEVDANDAEEENQAVQDLTEVAVAIPLSSDNLYYLSGSGLLLQNEDFAYISGAEGARVISLQHSGQRVRVSVSDFSIVAISEDDMSLDEFLLQYGNKSVAQADQVSRRETALAGHRAAALRAAAQKVAAQRTAELNPLSGIDAFLA